VTKPLHLGDQVWRKFSMSYDEALVLFLDTPETEARWAL
jgi:hypothetical protein